MSTCIGEGKEWSRPLRGSGREVTFASFQVHGSQTTIIEIGGARLGLTAGPIPGSLQLMFDNSAAGTLAWKSLNVHVSTGKYSGKNFAALPTLTVALDPEDAATRALSADTVTGILAQIGYGPGTGPHWIAADGRWLLGPHQDRRNEYRLTAVLDGERRNLVIDRTFVDADGRRWIVDYKTSSHEGADIEGFLDREQQRYRTQLERYAAQMVEKDQSLGLYFPMLSGWRQW